MTREENARRRREQLVKAIMDLTEELGRAPKRGEVTERVGMSHHTANKHLQVLLDERIVKEEWVRPAGKSRHLALSLSSE